ncbi:hypothetical protein GCM10009839_58920 [Catenulispora yoronensis]|uniref:Uncharacterized protein n=1 Tax=Catenulispora yoronensis TaxID=450799 RepID=A0ABN2V0N3_9ACTN
MTDPNPGHEPPEPTKNQAQVIEGLRAACTSLMILPLDQPAPNLPPGARIAWYTGLISAAIDTLAARADLYAPDEQYAPSAVTGYATGLAMIFHGRPRRGMAFRLNTYSALIHPPGLTASIDPATSAIQQAVTASARMLLVTGSSSAPGDVTAAFQEARTMLLRSARFAAAVVKADPPPSGRGSRVT